MLSVPDLANIKKAASRHREPPRNCGCDRGCTQASEPTDGALGTLRGVDERGVV
jgi:hypothetical protein